MNTARAFGPAVVSGFPDGIHWVVSYRGILVSPSYAYILSVLGWTRYRSCICCGVLWHPQTVSRNCGLVVHLI